MKVHPIILLLTLVGSTLAGEPIPVREPEPGESRPPWWQSLWRDHIAVVEGTIEWREDREPEIQISADPAILKSMLGQEEADLIRAYRKFRIGRIKTPKVLFVSPGIKLRHASKGRYPEGRFDEMDFLLPILEVEEHQIGPAENDESGVFIFRYGSMVMGLPLIFHGKIPESGMASATAIFEHRNRLNHRDPANFPEKPATTGEPAPEPAAKSEDGGNPQPTE